jgi:hypothetical protein
LTAGDGARKITVEAPGDLPIPNMGRPQNLRRKRPNEDHAGNERFAKTGWWAHQGSNLGPAHQESRLFDKV